MNVCDCVHRLSTLTLVTMLTVVLAVSPAYAQVGGVLSHTMAKSIDPSTGAPLVNATQFLTTDDVAHSWFEIRMDTFGPVTLVWKWKDPTGSIYRESPSRVELVEKGKTYRFWDTLQIKGTAAALRNGTWQVEVFARADMLFTETFSIQPPPVPFTTYKVIVTVSGFRPTFSTTIYVDQVNKGAVTGESSRVFVFDVGAPHVLSVDQLVSGDKGVRYFCPIPSWTTPTLPGPSLTPISDSSYTFIYRTQYELTVNSEYGTPKGAGWYNAGESATFSVSTPIAGTIGVQYIFERWSGDSASAESQATIVMNGPKSVTAKWFADYTMFYLMVGIIAGCAAILAIMPIVASRRRVPKTKGPALPRPGPPAPLCKVCHRPTIYVAQTNKYFCAYCKKYS